MDDALCGENIKAWRCAIILNGTKETVMTNIVFFARENQVDNLPLVF